LEQAKVEIQKLESVGKWNAQAADREVFELRSQLTEANKRIKAETYQECIDAIQALPFSPRVELDDVPEELPGFVAAIKALEGLKKKVEE
jgi:hypothetical protein